MQHTGAERKPSPPTQRSAAETAFGAADLSPLAPIGETPAAAVVVRRWTDQPGEVRQPLST
jgi:hypothetical protein